MSCDPLLTGSGDHVTNEKRYIFTPTRSMAAKPDSKVAFDEKILSTKSHNSLTTWTHQII